MPPQVIIGGINTAQLWYRLYAEYPYVYVLIYLVIDFVFAGLTACLALMVSFYTEKRRIVLFTPFVLHVFLYSLCGMLGDVYAMGYAPTYFLLAGFGSVDWRIFPVFVLLYLSAGVGFILKGCRDDVFLGRERDMGRVKFVWVSYGVLLILAVYSMLGKQI